MSEQKEDTAKRYIQVPRSEVVVGRLTHYTDSRGDIVEYEISQHVRVETDGGHRFYLPGSQVLFLTPREVAAIIRLLGKWLTEGWAVYRVNAPGVSEPANVFAPSPGVAIEIYLAQRGMLSYDEIECISVEDGTWILGEIDTVLEGMERQGVDLEEYCATLDQHHHWISEGEQ